MGVRMGLKRKSRKKTGGKDWKKGQSGNPNGRPPLPQDLKEARALNKEEFERVANKYLYLSEPELWVVKRRQDTPMLDQMVIGLLLMTSTHGCQKRFAFLLDRLLGKLKNTVEVEGINLEQLVAGSYDGKEK
jgi:hypothetical protein